MPFESDIVAGEERSLTLVSGETTSWTDRTIVDVTWTCFFLGDDAGTYKASPVKVAVYPPSHRVTGVDIQLVERHGRSGTVARSETFRLQPNGSSFDCEFEWTSTAAVPEQELSVRLLTDEPAEPEMLLKDPISRRRNFLLALGR